MSNFIANDQRVVDFVTKANGLGSAPVHASLGLERDGEIVAGIIYTDFNGTNVCLHVASKPGVNWVSRALLRMVFGMAFDGFRVKRITGFVPETNSQARKFDEHCGFKLEATLRDIFPDGGLCVYRMMREDCKYV